MKATGIIRRVDELGRVVIPKEIRRTMGIKEATPLEIYCEDGKLVLQKYEPSVRAQVESLQDDLLYWFYNYADDEATAQIQDVHKAFDTIMKFIDHAEK